LVRSQSLFFWFGLMMAALALAILTYHYFASAVFEPRSNATAQTEDVAKRAGAQVTPTTPPLKIEPK
jgi:uncharacterized protein YpmS